MPPRLVLAPFADEPAVDWCSFFGNSNPVEIEIGSGKGAFLLDYARRHRQRNFLAIEWQLRWVRHMAERARSGAIGNLDVLHADAELVVRRFIPGGSVARYHLYFPDPWWKRRHHKRRLIRDDVVPALFRTLVRGGDLLLITDVSARFDDMIAELSRQPFEVETGEDALPPDRPPTNYERKYRAQGRPLFFARLTRPRKEGGRQRRARS